MGFIEPKVKLPSGNQKKALYVLWFRAPKTTVDAITKEYRDYKKLLETSSITPTRRPLLGTIPLIVMGSATKVKDIENKNTVFGSLILNNLYFDGSSWYEISTQTIDTITSKFVLKSTSKDADPMYIGIDCTGPYPALSVNIVMPSDNLAEFKGVIPVGTNARTGTYNTYFNCCVPGPGGPDGMGLGCFGYDQAGMTQTYETDNFVQITASNGDAFYGRGPETFRLLPHNRTYDVGTDVDTADKEYGGIRVTPDHWHVLIMYHNLSPCDALGTHETKNRHALNPFQPVTESVVTSSKKTKSASKMHVSLDDVNYVRSNLSCYHPDDGDPNDVLTVHGAAVRGTTQATVNESYNYDCSGKKVQTSLIVDQPRFKFTPKGVDNEKFKKIGLPATEEYVDAIRKVEMGDCQIFFDVDVETFDEKFRRKIITEKGRPVPMSVLAKFFDKDPEFKLRGRNWKKGINTGTTGPSVPPKSGNFVGDIKSYSPLPNLNDNQGKSN